MALNFIGAFQAWQHAMRLMQGRAGIRKTVNISSNGADRFDALDPPRCRASNAALATLTKDLARRFAIKKSRRLPARRR